jgi:hypothetical protein
MEPRVIGDLIHAYEQGRRHYLSRAPKRRTGKQRRMIRSAYLLGWNDAHRNGFPQLELFRNVRACKAHRDMGTFSSEATG